MERIKYKNFGLHLASVILYIVPLAGDDFEVCYGLAFQNRD